MRLATALWLTVLSSACGDLLAFPVEAEVQEFTVPGNPYGHHEGASLAADSVPPVDVDLPSSISPGKVALSALELELTPTALGEDDQDDLCFLDGIDVYMRPTNPDVDLPTILVASWRGPALKTDTVVALNIVARYDLAPYLASGFQLDMRAAGVVPYDDVSIRGRVEFEVNPF